MTKEMRPAHRIDVLAHALVYYGMKRRTNYVCQILNPVIYNPYLSFNLLLQLTSLLPGGEGPSKSIPLLRRLSRSWLFHMKVN